MLKVRTAVVNGTFNTDSIRITRPPNDGPVARFTMPHEVPQVVDGLSRSVRDRA